MNIKELFFTPYGIIIVICVVLYFAPTLLNIPTLQFQSIGWKSNVAINDGEWYRLISAIFLHGSFLHLFLNMYSLWAVTPTVTSIFGSLGKNPNLVFISIFLISGICGNILSYYFNSSNSLGASGAIFGLIGAIAAFAILKQQTEIMTNILYVLGLNLILGLMPGSGIDNFGHLGGLIGGFLVGLGFLLL
jgi:rhomboid protease GluP